MKKLTPILLIPLLLVPVSLFSQPKRDASLKSLMLQFQKSKQESFAEIEKLSEENEALSFENRSLIIELEDANNRASASEVSVLEAQARIEALEEEMKVLKQRLRRNSIQDVEVLAMARPPDLERFGPDFSNSANNADQAMTPFTEPLSDSTLLLVNINTATDRELKMIPGVGGNLARKIINNRPYTSVWGLMKIEGVGKKRVENLAPHVTVE